MLRRNSKYAPVQAQYLGEDEDQNHRHEYLGFFNVGTDALHELCLSTVSRVFFGTRPTESPMMPMAYPAANPVEPHASPAPRCTKPE